MKAFARAFCGIGIAAALTGCGSHQLPTTAGGGAGLGIRPAVRSGHVKTWMLAEAKSEKLIYVSDMTNNQMHVLSYGSGKMVGSVAGPSETAGLCSDAHGNVYVAGDAEVVEYAHGGTTPIALFTYSGTEFGDCAVDPTTGNLAASMFDQHSVAIFQSANGNPDIVPLNKGIGGACAYDTKGDLIVDEGDPYYGISLEELPAKKSSFVTLATRVSSDYGHLQWYDRRLLLNVPDIQRFRIEGHQARQVGVVGLQGGVILRDMGGSQFVVQGGVAIVPYVFEDDFGMTPALLGFWSYPRGAFLKSYGGFGNDLLDGVAISSPTS